MRFLVTGFSANFFGAGFADEVDPLVGGLAGGEAEPFFVTGFFVSTFLASTFLASTFFVSTFFEAGLTSALEAGFA